MKKLIKKLEDIMVAVTFAEAGEYDEASRIRDENSPDLTGHGDSFPGTALENIRNK